MAADSRPLTSQHGTAESPVTEFVHEAHKPLPAHPSGLPVRQHGRRTSGVRVTLRPAVFITAALLLIAALAWYWLTVNHHSVYYKTVQVDRGPITSLITATGAVNPVVSVQVGSQVSGKIAKLYADFNSTVRAGQVIASIDQKPFQAKVRQARAQLKGARGNLAKARTMLAQRQLELDRMTVLRRQEFVSQADLDLAKTNHRDAEAQVEVTQAQVDQAKATLASAELDLGFTTIYSPVNGTVVSRNVEEGQTVVASFQTPTLFVIAQDLARMQVIANVSESDIGGITEGKSADFRVDAYRRETFHGVVTQVRNAPVSIQNVVTYDVVITADNPHLKLKPGMTANITIVTGRNDNALRVPNAALRFRMPGVPVDRTIPHIWAMKDGSPRALPVITGLADSLYTEIQGEIHEGDTVLVGLTTPEETAQQTLPPGFQMGPRMR